MPRVVYIKNDGEQFGELSLIDQDKVDQHTRDNPLNKVIGEEAQKLKYAKRSASCITTEQTDMLVVDSEFSQQLYQPGFGKSQIQ